jgi:hypothetical protein
MARTKPPWLASLPAHIMVCVILLSMILSATLTINSFLVPMSALGTTSTVPLHRQVRIAEPIVVTMVGLNVTTDATAAGPLTAPSEHSSQVGFGARQLTLGPSLTGMGSETAAAAASTDDNAVPKKNGTTFNQQLSQKCKFLHKTQILEPNFNAFKLNSCAFHTAINNWYGKNQAIQKKSLRACTHQRQPIPTAPVQQPVEPAKPLVRPSVNYYKKQSLSPLETLRTNFKRCTIQMKHRQQEHHPTTPTIKFKKITITTSSYRKTQDIIPTTTNTNNQHRLHFFSLGFTGLGQAARFFPRPIYDLIIQLPWDTLFSTSLLRSFTQKDSLAEADKRQNNNGNETNTTHTVESRSDLGNRSYQQNNPVSKHYNDLQDPGTSRFFYQATKRAQHQRASNEPKGGSMRQCVRKWHHL